MKIIHLACLHHLPDKSTSEVRAQKPGLFEEVARSQFLAARYIRANPNMPVLQEGATVDQSSLRDVDIITKIYFPNGFPDSYEELTSEQKEHLYEFGAARIMFGLGVIPALYKSIHESVGEAFDKKIEKKLAKGKYYDQIDYVSIKREKEAIECAKEAAIERYGNAKDAEVIVVFGRAHNFKPLCAEQGIEHLREETDREKPLDLKHGEKSEHQNSFFGKRKKLSDKEFSSKSIENYFISIGKYTLVFNERGEGYRPSHEMKVLLGKKEVDRTFLSEKKARELLALAEDRNANRLIDKIRPLSNRAEKIATMLKDEGIPTLSTKEGTKRESSQASQTGEKEFSPSIIVGKYKLQLTPGKDYNELRLFKNEKEIAYTAISDQFFRELVEVIKENNINLVIEKLKDWDGTALDMAKKLQKYSSLLDKLNQESSAPVTSQPRNFLLAQEEKSLSNETTSTQPTSNKIKSIEIGKYNLKLKPANDDQHELTLFENGKEIKYVRGVSNKTSLEIAALIEENYTDGVISRLEKMGKTSEEIAARLKEENRPNFSGSQQGIFSKNTEPANKPIRILAKKPKANKPLPRLK